jgi:putative transposase
MPGNDATDAVRASPHPTRFWKHVIRDDRDFERHVDYIHWNPVKHGWVKRVCDWPHSSFHAYVRRGVYPEEWACDLDSTIDAGE